MLCRIGKFAGRQACACHTRKEHQYRFCTKTVESAQAASFQVVLQKLTPGQGP